MKRVIAGLVFAAICTRADEPSVKLPAALARVLTNYEAAWRKKDAAALASLFAADGFVMAPGTPMVRGRQAIEKLYSGEGGPLFLRAVSYGINGDLGYILGGFSNKSAGQDDGKFTLTLKRDATGKWLIMSDMDNGNRR